MARNFQSNLIVGGDSRGGVQAMRRVRGEMDKTRRSGGQLGRRFREINRRGLTLNGTLGKLGLTLSAGFVVGGTVRALSQIAASADEIGKKSRNIGITAEALQELRGAGQLAGLSIRDTDDALRRFNRRLGLFITDGTGPAAKSVDRLGLTLTDAQGRFIGAEAAFNQTIDRIAELPTTAQQAAEAAQLFGDDAGPKLVTLLSQGSEGIAELRRQVRETGSIMSDEAVAAAEEYADASFLLGQRIKGIGVQIATGLIPGLTGTLKAMSETSAETEALSGFGEGLAAAFNVVIRAGIILRETVLGIGEVIVGLGVTVVGTFRKIVAPIEGTIRTAAEATQQLLDGNFKAAAAAVKGLGDEISTAAGAADAQINRGVGFLSESIETRVNNALEGVAALSAGLDETGETAKATVEEIEPTADAIEKVAAKTYEFETRLASLNKELSTKLQKSVIEFNEQMAELFQLFATGRLDFDEFEQLADLVEQRLNRDVAAFQNSMIDLAFSTLPAVVQQMLGLADATGQVSDRAAGFGQIGRNFATAILNGQGVQDSISSSLTAFGGQGIGAALEDTFAKAAEGGLSAAFDSEGFKKNSAEGFALALGQAAEGQLGQAAFTAIGNAIGGPIGALIGSIIGDAIFGESVPKFQVRGTRATQATDAGTDQTVDGPLGRIEFAFRGIEDQAKSQIVRAFTQFDQSIASIIRDEGQLGRVSDALDRFGVSSRSGPDDIEGQLRLRFDAILGTFDGFTQSFVNVADTLEGKVQRLADIFAIENRLLLGQGFGLTGASIGAGAGGGIVPPGGGGGGGGTPIDPPGGGGGISPDPILRPSGSQVAAFQATIQGTGDAAAVTNPVLQQTLLLLDELAIGGESLVETFDRLTSVVGTLDTVIALTNGQLAESRAGLVRFGAGLAEIFGDNADAVAAQFGTIFETFFTDEERFTVAADQARAQGEDLLRQLLSGVEGFEFAERFLTKSGFRELFDELLQSGELSADQLAVLSQAGVTIAELIAAEGELAKIRGEAVEAARDEAAVQGFLRDVGNQALQVLAPARLQFAQLSRQLEENARQAAELNLTESELNIVRLSAQIQTQQFIAGLSESIGGLNDRLFGGGGSGTVIDQAGAQIEQGVRNMRDAWLSAIDQITRALDDQLVGPNSSLTNRERLNESQSQLREAIAAAQGGDVDAAQQIGRLFNQTIAQGASFFGTSTDDFAEFEAQIRALVSGANLTAPAAPAQQTAVSTAATADNTRQIELSAFEQIQLATQLVDQIGILSTLTEQSPSEIGEQFGIPIGELIGVLTGEVPEATGAALASLFDDVVGETNDALNELASLESTAAEQLDTLNAIARIAERQLMFFEQSGDKFRQTTGPSDPSGPGTGGNTATAMATGGIVTRPTFGLVGEAGPEAVIPLSRLNSGGVERRLDEIKAAIVSGNADRRAGLELTIEEQEQLRAMLSRSQRDNQLDALRPAARPGGIR